MQISQFKSQKSAFLLKKKLLLDKDNRIVFSVLKNREGYLVGGAVRDALMGRKSPDKDYIVKGNLKPILTRIRTLAHGKLVKIGKYDLYKIITSRNTILDFTPLKVDILEDLSARDFALNAMAWSPNKGLIDPCSGLNDIKSKRIRMISPESLLEDPIRMLRAFRLAQELGFKIDIKTMRKIKTISHLIEHQKTERITLDFFRILGGDNPLKTLAKMNEAGILKHIFYINNRQFQHLYQRLIKIMSQYNETSLKVDIPEIDFGFGIHRREIMILELLTHGKKEVNLALTRKMREYLRRFSAGMSILQKEKRITNTVLFRIFETSKDSSLDVLFSAGKARHIHKYIKYLKVLRDPLARGHTIKSLLKLKEGPVVGRIAAVARRALFEGTLKDKRGLENLRKRI